MTLLLNHEHLNDTIINSYIELLNNYIYKNGIEEFSVFDYYKKKDIKKRI